MRFLLVAVLVGCGADSPTADTGVWLCGDGRCAEDVAADAITAKDLRGDALAPAAGPSGPVVLVGNAWEAPYEWAPPEPFVAVVSLPGLKELARWSGPYELGSALAVADDGAGGQVVAIGAPGARTDDHNGAVYLLDGVVESPIDVPTAAAATLVGSEQYDGRFGFQVAFGDPGGAGQEVVAAYSGFGIGPYETEPGVLCAFALPVAGTVTCEGDADRRIVKADRAAGPLALWDGDGDGIDDVVSSDSHDVQRFASPWVGDLTEADVATTWTGAEDLSAITNLGDLDGDGLAELGIGNHTEPEPERRGAVWLVRGGDVAGGDLAAAADRIEGEAEKLALGRELRAADLDGDGALELLVGAADLGAYTGGQIFAFSPALGGVLTTADAIAVVHGTEPWAGLGRALAVVDPDGDGASDVLSCENHPFGDAVTCWRLPGAALAP